MPCYPHGNNCKYKDSDGDCSYYFIHFLISNARRMSRRLFGRLDSFVGASLYLFCASQFNRLCLILRLWLCNSSRVGADTAVFIKPFYCLFSFPCLYFLSALRRSRCALDTHVCESFCADILSSFLPLFSLFIICALAAPWPPCALSAPTPAMSRRGNQL